MFNFFKKDKKKPEQVPSTPEPQVIKKPKVEEKPQPKEEKKQSSLSRLSQGLTKTRVALNKGFLSLTGQQAINEDILEQIEETLLMSDMGIETTNKVIEMLQEQSLWEKASKDPRAIEKLLNKLLTDSIKPHEQPLQIDTSKKPFVIMMVGVNGAGKTTTIGKLAKQLTSEGKKVMLAAGDTFRAAAVEQLVEWGKRNDIPVMAQGQNADSAAVIYDALESARAKDYDVLIADTAGRLHNKEHLMQELHKVKKVMSKQDPAAPHEVMLVLDSTLGQNNLQQAKQFNELIGITGVTLTKLDGTAKGGIIFSLTSQLKLPIRYIGLGEGIDDLQKFEAQSFVDGLLSG